MVNAIGSTEKMTNTFLGDIAPKQQESYEGNPEVNSSEDKSAILKQSAEGLRTQLIRETELESPPVEDLYQEIEVTLTEKIKTPSLAKREEARIELPNGLQAYIVSDPEIDKSGATVMVRSGSWNDPKEAPGTAHFVEHLLFMGTERYPSEEEYERYILENGGFFNAYTASDHTAYMFSIDPKTETFFGALDRFSAFFSCPLLHTSSVEREINAIHNEFGMQLNNDAWRVHMVQRELSDSSHPNNMFSIGNLESLSTIDPKGLLEWYKKQYSANLMTLVVYGRESVEDLKKVVVEKFSDVPNRQVEHAKIEAPLFNPELAGSLTVVEPLKDIRDLELSWSIPTHLAAMIKSQPDKIVSHLLGDEGNQSLLAQLRREGLAQEIGAGMQREGKDHAVFELRIGLTEAGVKDLDTVRERVFQAIKGFQESGCPEYIFNESQNLAKMAYQYQGRQDTFRFLMGSARNLRFTDLAEYPVAGKIPQEFNESAVNEMLALLKPSTAHYTLTAPEELTGIKSQKTEKWMQVPYSVHPMTEETKKLLESVKAHPAIGLPPANPYIASDLNIMSTEADNTSPSPEKIASDDFGTVYFHADSCFRTPKVAWSFKILSPEIREGDASKKALQALFIKAVKEQMSTESYPALLAGLQYNLGMADNGIQLVVAGYNEKASVLLKKVVSALKNLDCDEQNFSVYKDALVRQLLNPYKASPIVWASEDKKMLFNKEAVRASEIASALENMTLEDLKSYASTVFKQSHIESVLWGDMTKEQALDVSKLMRTELQESGFSKDQHVKKEIVQLPKAAGPFMSSRDVDVEGNVALLTVQHGQENIEKSAVLQMLSKAIDQPFFDELRTKQQTGYSVYAISKSDEEQMFTQFIVQSKTHNSRDLLARFELFIENFLKDLGADKFDEERFEGIRSALVTSTKDPAKNHGEMLERLNTLAFDRDGDFKYREKLVKALEELKFEDFISTAREFLGRENLQRVAVLVNGKTLPEESMDYVNVSSIQELKDKSTYHPKGN